MKESEISGGEFDRRGDGAHTHRIRSYVPSSAEGFVLPWRVAGS